MYEFKYGYIYKITNLINNKVYIGQVYNKSIETRFIRHCKCANPKSYSYLSRAIYKYGKENFKFEEIEECYSIKELNEREKYWIAYYNSTNSKFGYNLTLGGEGGNTYLCKSVDEMNVIKTKISNANKGKNNGNSNQLKIKSIITEKEYHFETLDATIGFFKIKCRGLIMAKARHLDNTLFRKEWLIAFEDDEYQNYNMPNEHSRGTKVKLTNIETNEELIFGSRNALYKYLGLKNRLNFPTNIIYYDKYKLELLK